MLPAVGGTVPMMSAASCLLWVEADGVLVGLTLPDMKRRAWRCSCGQRRRSTVAGGQLSGVDALLRPVGFSVALCLFDGLGVASFLWLLGGASRRMGDKVRFARVCV